MYSLYFWNHISAVFIFLNHSLSNSRRELICHFRNFTPTHDEKKDRDVRGNTSVKTETKTVKLNCQKINCKHSKLL